MSEETKSELDSCRDKLAEMRDEFKSDVKAEIMKLILYIECRTDARASIHFGRSDNDDAYCTMVFREEDGSEW